VEIPVAIDHEQLPEDIWGLIFTKFEYARDAYRCSLVSKTWNKLATHKSVWKALSRRCWGKIICRVQRYDGSWKELFRDRNSRNMTAEDLPEIAVLLKSKDARTQLDATVIIRKLLSLERDPPITAAVELGIVPIMIEFLKRKEHPQLQFEAAWVLTNIASGTSEHTRAVLESGAVPAFVQLAQENPADDDRSQQAVWALGNIAGDSPQMRDFVIMHNAVPVICQVLSTAQNVSTFRQGVWTMSNLCRGKPQPSWDTVKQCIPVLARILSSTDTEVLTDACWALSYLSDGPNDRIDAVLQSGCLPKLISMLNHTDMGVKTPALRSVGNFVTGDDQQTQMLVDAGIVENLVQLLNCPRKGIRKEACWALSNITAGNRVQIQVLIHVTNV